MEILQDPLSMQSWSLEQKARGQILGFVPTMGNLHDGHLSLVEEARRRCARVVVSIFVNPLQFSAGEDFDKYPRTFEQDRDKLAPFGVDAIFFPDTQAMYPAGKEVSTQVYVPSLGDILCGASRPGHFQGVTTVVAKLFTIVQPDVAVFGEKDFQQLFLIRRMAEDLFMPVEIVGMPTHREKSGLAMSSRNGYLSEEQRHVAEIIFQTLRSASESIKESDTPIEQILANSLSDIANRGLKPEYFELRSAETLQTVSARGQEQELVLLAAAKLGNTRLIDNLRLSLKIQA
ncbi:MAG: pantoate--beta-alanine ligase [Gammaproteobacteria bacterium]|nr:pantoate--beta-alanine ligase [Gammaproteobacteria bacterium]